MPDNTTKQMNLKEATAALAYATNRHEQVFKANNPQNPSQNPSQSPENAPEEASEPKGQQDEGAEVEGLKTEIQRMKDEFASQLNDIKTQIQQALAEDEAEDKGETESPEEDKGEQENEQETSPKTSK